MKYILRIIMLPFFAFIVLVSVIRLFCTHCYNFMRFGGESIVYTQKNQPTQIHDIYLELTAQRKAL